MYNVHAKELLDSRKKELEVLVEKAGRGKGTAEAEVLTLRGQFEVEATRNVALETSKNEVSSKVSYSSLSIL